MRQVDFLISRILSPWRSIVSLVTLSRGKPRIPRAKCYDVSRHSGWKSHNSKPPIKGLRYRATMNISGSRESRSTSSDFWSDVIPLARLHRATLSASAAPARCSGGEWRGIYNGCYLSESHSKERPRQFDRSFRDRKTENTEKPRRLRNTWRVIAVCSRNEITRNTRNHHPLSNSN